MQGIPTNLTLAFLQLAAAAAVVLAAVAVVVVAAVAVEKAYPNVDVSSCSEWRD